MSINQGQICILLRKKNKKQKGFSFGEILISAFVITAGLTATTALIAKSLTYSYQNRDAVIAATLSQEGVELVRNVRDQNFADEISGTPSGQGFQYFSNPNKHCRVDVSDVHNFHCQPSMGTPGGRSYFLQTPANPGGGGRFLHTSTPDRFGRYIFIDYNNANHTARVVSFVFWDWGVAGAMPSSIGNNGNTSFCSLDVKCVFTEVFFTNWGVL